MAVAQDGFYFLHFVKVPSRNDQCFHGAAEPNNLSDLFLKFQSKVNLNGACNHCDYTVNLIDIERLQLNLLYQTFQLESTLCELLLSREY